MDRTLLQRAETLLAQRNVGRSIAAFHRAEARGVDADSCAAGRWMAHMLTGDYAAAWQESDAIRRRAAPDAHRFWEGEDLRGRMVILRCLHGLGDAVQFLRYAPRLRALASHLVLEVPPALVEVAPLFDGVEDVITWGPSAPAVPARWDVQIEIMELPFLFRTELKHLPIAQGYLWLPEELKNKARQVVGAAGPRRVGIVWAAGAWNPERSIPLAALHSLLRTPGCEFWSLQGGEAQKEWKMLNPPALRDAGCFGDGILNLAAMIAQLDLVITVDTLAAHLAGALGKPAWVLLQFAADWRWMLGRSDSPWYPSLRLFRQSAPGEWRDTLSSVRQALALWTLGEAA